MSPSNDIVKLAVSNLDSHRNASPHAPVHIARAATPQQHPQLHLLKLAQLQTGYLTVVVHQILPGLGVPDVAGEGPVGWGCLTVRPGVTGPHHRDTSRLGSHVSLHTSSMGTGSQTAC